ncbi:MAG TPA: DUF4062 domain-containing protein, partial [Nitrospira sp.]|nr:DUF4062 domain-containing protein [Nitrospira sp.]
MASDELLIDLRSSATKPSDEDIRVWASAQRVFISSVINGLKPERARVAAAILALGAEPIWFEHFGGRDADPEDAYLSEVASSTIYVGILGRNYGSLHKGLRLSATHAEYREAEQSGLRICVWTSAAGDWLADQQRFVEEVRTFHVTGDFESPEQLADSVSSRLKGLAAEDLSPWCKLGDVVFRAARIRDTGKDIAVSAAIHDHAVVAALEGMRPNWWNSTDHQLTYASRSRLVEVKQVIASVETSRSTKVDILVVPSSSQSDDRPVHVTIGSNDYTTDDLIEINLRKALFGTAGPPLTQIIGGTIKDPLAPLRRTHVPDELVR